MLYAKIASEVKTVGQLLGILSQLDGETQVQLTPGKELSVAISDTGRIVVLGEPKTIDEFCDPEGLPFY